jgi:hypothetical protein
VLEHVLLAHKAVLADGKAVVAGEKDDGVARAPGGVDRVQHAPDLGIEPGDERVIFGAVHPDGLRRAGVRRKPFVAQGMRAADHVLVGMGRHEIRGQRKLVGRIGLHHLARLWRGSCGALKAA